jgi:hypothetical protein
VVVLRLPPYFNKNQVLGDDELPSPKFDEDSWSWSLRPAAAPSQVIVGDDEFVVSALATLDEESWVSVGSSVTLRPQSSVTADDDLAFAVAILDEDSWVSVYPSGVRGSRFAVTSDDELVFAAAIIDEDSWFLANRTTVSSASFAWTLQDEELATPIQPPAPTVKFGRQFPRKPRGLAFIPNKDVREPPPLPVFTAQVSSHHECEAVLDLSVRIAAVCSSALVSSLTIAAGSPAVRAESSAALSLEPSSVGAVGTSATYSATYGAEGASSANSEALADLTWDPKNKRPLSDKEVLDAMEALSKRPKKK